MKFTGNKNRFIRGAALLLFASLPSVADLHAGELFVGTATADITPALPVALSGQFHLRIAKTIETPLTVNVIALESRDGNHPLDTAVMVSCDVVGVPAAVLNMVRAEVKKQIPGFNVMKVFLTATHTHTAPVMENDINCSFRYEIPEEGVLQVDEYNASFVKRAAEAIVKAWKDRRKGNVSWAMSHAAIAYNRRAVYADGTAVMYGKTNVAEFRNLEGIEDHDINMLFFWDMNGKLIAMTVDAGCTAQEVEGRSAVNADYWHPVRERLKQRFGPDLVVVGWISAAGDQSPRPLYRQAAEERMIRLRNLSRLDEIARRIFLAVEEAYETVEQDRYTDVPLVHRVMNITLPMRLVTEEEYKTSVSERDDAASLIEADPGAAARQLARLTWNMDVIKRYDNQKITTDPTIESEVHVLRLGDVAVCTNEFELFTDYSLRIQARSNALQTFVVQLAAGNGSYLPTEKAVKGGGYSAVIQSALVSPEGGQILVERIVAQINDLFPSGKK